MAGETAELSHEAIFSREYAAALGTVHPADLDRSAQEVAHVTYPELANQNPNSFAEKVTGIRQVLMFLEGESISLEEEK